MLKSPWDLLIFICFLFLVKHNQIHPRQPIWSSAQTDNVWIDIVDTFHFPLIIIACALHAVQEFIVTTFLFNIWSRSIIRRSCWGRPGPIGSPHCNRSPPRLSANIFWINIEINFDSYNLRHLVRLQMFWIIFSKKTAIASFGKKSCSMNTWTSKWF